MAVNNAKKTAMIRALCPGFFAINISTIRKMKTNVNESCHNSDEKSIKYRVKNLPLKKGLKPRVIGGMLVHSQRAARRTAEFYLRILR